jgi:tripartite ATP-independent transporter DctM subunit
MKRGIHPFQLIHGFENWLVAIGLFLMAFFPIIEIGSRVMGIVGLTGTTDYVRHLTLWVGFLGAILTAREERHLSIHTGIDALPERLKRIIKISTTVVATAVCASLAWAGLEFVRSEYSTPTQIAGWIPQWVAIIIIPIGFGFVTLRLIWHSSDHWSGRIISATGPILAIAIGFLLTPIQIADLLIPGLILLIIAGIVGSPIFSVLGGIALLLFMAEDISVAAIPIEAYRIVASPILPTVPLFTLAGYILAEGGASRRLVRLFRALLGWMPGGVAVAATCVCTFFTIFTGASGVTILALGGLLLPVLVKNGFKKRFSIGLLTSTGSLGLLFPPCLPVIFYGVISHTPIDKLFLAGIIPGMLLLIVISLFGVQQGLRSSIKPTPFNWREAGSALWESKWEVALPFVALFGIFGGFTTIVEASAITVIYALITECFIYKDIRIKTDLIPAFIKTATIVGGILIILSVAMGLTNYMVDAQIPLRAADWVRANIECRIVFLLMLNLFLLMIGCLMDIFSAIMVVVPLIIPMGEVFDIHPLHLGIIFLANLELGYLTPPVGLNLFLSSFRFERPLIMVYRDTIPFFLLLLSVVLLITYVPSLTLFLAGE